VPKGFGGIRRPAAAKLRCIAQNRKSGEPRSAALLDRKIKVRLAEFGSAALVRSPVDLGKLIAVETDKWGR